MPGAARIITAFAQFLAPRLHTEASAASFVAECQLLLRDMHLGECTRTGQPIQSDYARMPPSVYSLLWSLIPQIAESIFPRDYASAVTTLIQVNCVDRTIH